MVVGDLVGHGLSAAADMALIRGMITALLVEEADQLVTSVLDSLISGRSHDDDIAVVVIKRIASTSP